MISVIRKNVTTALLSTPRIDCMTQHHDWNIDVDECVRAICRNSISFEKCLLLSRVIFI